MQLTQDKIINSIKNVFDPDVGVNIYDLGLIYDISINSINAVNITMTLTSPFCPSGDDIIDDVRNACHIAGATNVDVNITFEPSWGPTMISEEGKLELGLF